jgi:hypothetical protein
MYTIGSSVHRKHLSVRHMNVDYVIALKNVTLARAIHYSLPPYPELTLVRGKDLVVTVGVDVIERHVDEGIIVSSSSSSSSASSSTRLIIDPTATLFMPKADGTIWHPLNDAGYYLDLKKESEVLAMPVKERRGIVLPQGIKSETDDEFVLSAFVIEPAIFRPGGPKYGG